MNAMNWDSLQTIFALAPRGGEGQADEPPAWVSLMPIVLMVVIFYFLLIRPQQKKAKEHAELVKSLRVGDKVVTNGGVVGVIVSLKDKSVSLRSSDTKLEVLKSAINEVTERGESQPES